jgi:hypothetical protein
MDLLQLVDENISGVINRLKQLESPELKQMYGDKIMMHIKYATEMLRALIIHRETVKNNIANSTVLCQNANVDTKIE